MSGDVVAEARESLTFHAGDEETHGRLMEDVSNLIAEVEWLRDWQQRVAETVDIEAGIGQAYLDPDTAAAWLRELVAELGRLRTSDEHYTDEPRTETEYGINCGDPAECCDPWFITDDPGTASENMQVIREPHALMRTVVTTYGPWEPVDLEAIQ